MKEAVMCYENGRFFFRQPYKPVTTYFQHRFWLALDSTVYISAMRQTDNDMQFLIGSLFVWAYTMSCLTW